jgi:hypothetical protein
VLRDVAIVAVAGFMLIYETIATASPSPYLIGAGLTLLGIPPALRFDELFRPKEEKGDE